MPDSLRLKQVTISGFRGYGKNRETLDLLSPAVILEGGNRTGKSSTLNAIEWAIYGDKVTGKSGLNIEERKGWIVKNRNSDRLEVKLVLETKGGEITVYRSSSGGRGKKERSFVL